MVIDRHQYILDQLHRDGRVNVLELCKELKVSSVTIRKDLKLLEKKNLLFRTHGGANASNPYTVDRPVNEKEKLQSSEKADIATIAAQLIEPNDSIIIASGTTVLALAKKIQIKGSLTVVTSALNVAIELIKHPDVEVIQLGGFLRRSSSSVTGPYAETTLHDFFCTKLFLGVDGIDLELGLTTTNSMEAQLNKLMIARAQETVAVADASKLGRRSLSVISPASGAHKLITDHDAAPEHVAALRALGVDVSLV